MRISRRQTRVLAIVTVVAIVLAIAACGGDDVSQQEVAQLKEQLAQKETEVTQLQAQLASTGSTTVVQAGQLAPVPAGAQPTGWDTTESIRGGVEAVCHVRLQRAGRLEPG